MPFTAVPFALPPEYPRVKVVHSFAELVGTPFADGVNALCWARTLPGDFDEVVARLSTTDGITTLDDDTLRALPLSVAGRAAVECLIEDQRLLRAAGLAPLLDCIHGYPRDETPDVVATDVYSFHADSAPVPADTYLCSYTEAASEGLPNEHAIRRVDIAETRAALLARFGGADDAEFAAYLREHCYDLHYAARTGAQPFSFGLGNLWRIAIEYPGCPVPPCVHRAPETPPDRPPRLLLIS
jgi:hypothetical protein